MVNKMQLKTIDQSLSKLILLILVTSRLVHKLFPRPFIQTRTNTSMVDRLCSFRYHVTLIGPMVLTAVGVRIGSVIATFRLALILIFVLRMQRDFRKLRFNVHNVAVPKKMVLSISMILNEMVIAKSSQPFSLCKKMQKLRLRQLRRQL